MYTVNEWFPDYRWVMWKTCLVCTVHPGEGWVARLVYGSPGSYQRRGCRFSLVSSPPTRTASIPTFTSIPQSAGCVRHYIIELRFVTDQNKISKTLDHARWDSSAGHGQKCGVIETHTKLNIKRVLLLITQLLTSNNNNNDDSNKK